MLRNKNFFSSFEPRSQQNYQTDWCLKLKAFHEMHGKQTDCRKQESSESPASVANFIYAIRNDKQANALPCTR